MARRFRLFEKKRGDRRTGSNLVGSVSEALFFSGIFLLGVLSLSALLATKFIDESPFVTVRIPTPGFGFWLMILVLTSFVILGASGLIWTVLRIGVSAERRSAMARSAEGINPLEDVAPRHRDFPTVPPHDGLTNSPGIELAYRLPPSQSPGWRLLATTLFALAATGVGSILTVLAVKSFVDHKPEWLLSLFLLPYWGVAGGSLYFLIRLIRIHTGMGPTTIEISDHPLIPGREYQVSLSQHGHIDVRKLQLVLRCEEDVTYRQGTDLRSESRVVHEHTLLVAENIKIVPSEAYQQTCLLAIPSDAMHSFESPHAAVHWRLVVKGLVEGWPPFQRGFAIVVHPGEATQRAEQQLQQEPLSLMVPASVSAAPLPSTAGARA